LDRDDRGFTLIEVNEFVSMGDAIGYGRDLINSGKVGGTLEIHLETAEGNSNGWGNVWENINFEEKAL